MAPTSRALLAIGFALLTVAACGSSAPPPSANRSASGATAAATGLPAGSAAGAPTATPAAAPGTTDAATDFIPGPVGFRIVHLYRRPDGAAPALDVFARSDGAVVAYPIVTGLAAGTVTDYIHPPAGGGVVAMERGGEGQPACITNCSHFVVDSTSAFGQGDRRTVLIYPESTNFITGQTPSELAGTIEFWEDPDAASVGQTGNALAPADRERGLVFVVAAPVDEARFGPRLAFSGTLGCQENLNLPGVMIGGNQVPVFAIRGDTQITLHGNGDQDCSKALVGGPFAVTGTAGTRSYLFLHGTLADLKALSVPID
jgi:hypothetical protein